MQTKPAGSCARGGTGWQLSWQEILGSWCCFSRNGAGAGRGEGRVGEGCGKQPGPGQGQGACGGHGYGRRVPSVRRLLLLRHRWSHWQDPGSEEAPAVRTGALSLLPHPAGS